MKKLSRPGGHRGRRCCSQSLAPRSRPALEVAADRRHPDDQHGAGQRQLKFVGPERSTRGTNWKSSTRPTRNRSARTPSRWSPRARAEDERRRKNCFTPKHICMSIAKWHGVEAKTEKITINPVKAGAPAGARWATTARRATPGSPVKEAGTSITQRSPPTAGTTSTSSARSIPRCTARPRSCPPAKLTHDSDRLASHAPPGAPSLPRRPGRRRAGRCCCRSGARRRCSALGGAAPSAAGRGPVPGAAADPAGADAAPGSRSRSARPRCRSSRPRRRGSGPTAAPSRARPSAARPASAPRSPSTTSSASAGELRVHLHGGHNRTQFDGQPGGLTAPPPLLLLRIPQRPLAARVRQRPADRARRAAKPTSTTCARTASPNAPRSSGTTTTASTAPPATAGTGSPGCSSSTTARRGAAAPAR